MFLKAVSVAACVALYATNLSAGLPNFETDLDRTATPQAIEENQTIQLSKLNADDYLTLSDPTEPEIDPVDVLMTSISADPTGMSLPKPMRAASFVTTEPVTRVGGLMYFAPALTLILGGTLGLIGALVWRRRMALHTAG